jgi:hypothetical protein
MPERAPIAAELLAAVQRLIVVRHSRPMRIGVSAILDSANRRMSSGVSSGWFFIPLAHCSKQIDGPWNGPMRPLGWIKTAAETRSGCSLLRSRAPAVRSACAAR